MVEELIQNNLLTDEQIKYINEIKSKANAKNFSDKMSLKLPINVSLEKNYNQTFDVYISDFASLGFKNNAILIDTDKLASYAKFAEANKIELTNKSNLNLDLTDLEKDQKINMQD
ncbi:UNVERIFIED_CONTAM: hypothetical protein O8I53_11070 [Campylobacter lari]